MGGFRIQPPLTKSPIIVGTGSSMGRPGKSCIRASVPATHGFQPWVCTTTEFDHLPTLLAPARDQFLTQGDGQGRDALSPRRSGRAKQGCAPSPPGQSAPRSDRSTGAQIGGRQRWSRDRFGHWRRGRAGALGSPACRCRQTTAPLHPKHELWRNPGSAHNFRNRPARDNHRGRKP